MTNFIPIFPLGIVVCLRQRRRRRRPKAHSRAFWRASFSRRQSSSTVTGGSRCRDAWLLALGLGLYSLETLNLAAVQLSGPVRPMPAPASLLAAPLRFFWQDSASVSDRVRTISPEADCRSAQDVGGVLRADLRAFRGRHEPPVPRWRVPSGQSRPVPHA